MHNISRVTYAFCMEQTSSIAHRLLANDHSRSRLFGLVLEDRLVEKNILSAVGMSTRCSVTGLRQSIFSGLHGMPARTSDEKSARLSVCVQRKTVGDVPFCVQIWRILTHLFSKRRFSIHFRPKRLSRNT